MITPRHSLRLMMLLASIFLATAVCNAQDPHPAASPTPAPAQTPAETPEPAAASDAKHKIYFYRIGFAQKVEQGVFLNSNGVR